MMTSSLSAGFRAIRQRPGLAALLFLVHLAVALVLTVPLGVALTAGVGQTGFDTDLAHGLDIVLLADLFERHGDFLPTMIAQLIWLVPLLVAWRAAVGVGLVHALQNGGGRSFWTGVGRYFGRGVGLAVLFLVPAVVWIVGSIIVGFVLTQIWTGEVASVNTWAILVPLGVLFGLASTDLMHDYARIALVARDRPVFTAFTEGFLYPFRHGSTIVLYVLWFVPAAVVLLLPTWIEAVVGASLGVLLLQQLLLFGRAAMTVGWVGSEVALYESIEREPAIAEAAGELQADMPVGLA